MATWFFFVLCSVTVLACAEIAQKVALTTKENISAEANNFFVWIYQFILALIFVAFFTNTGFPQFTPQLVVNLFILGSLYFFAGTLLYTSFKYGSASISITLGTFSIVVSSLLGIIFLQESISVIKVAGIGLIFSAIIFLNIRKKEKFHKYNLLALAAGLIYGVAYTLDKTLVLDLNPHYYHIFFAASIAFASLLYRGQVILRDIPKLKRRNYIIMFFSALFFFFYNKFTFLSYSTGGEVGKIDAINNSAIFLVIVLEIILLKDKSNFKRKIVAAILAVSGVFILGFL